MAEAGAGTAAEVVRSPRGGGKWRGGGTCPKVEPESEPAEADPESAAEPAGGAD